MKPHRVAVGIAGVLVAGILAFLVRTEDESGPKPDAPPRESPSPTSSPKLATESREVSAPEATTKPASGTRRFPFLAPSVFEGVVVDASGVPVAGAEVAAVERSSGETLPTATTGTDGRFRLAFDDHVYRCVLIARSPGRATRGGTVTADVGERARIVLVPAVRVVVDVTDQASGAGVASALVEAFADVDGDDVESEAPFEIGVTDAKGRTSFFLAAPVRSVWVVVHAAGYGPTAADASPDEDPIAVRVALPRGGRVEGEVVDPDGRSVSGAEVRAVSARRYRAVVEADASGRFVLADVPFVSPDPQEPGGTGGLHLGAEAAGFPRASLKIESPGPEETVRAVLRLPRWRALTGRVTDGQGRGRPDLVVSFSHWSEDAFRDVGTPIEKTTSDADGGFSFERVPPGEGHLEVELSGGFQLASAEVAVPAEGEVPSTTIVVNDAPTGEATVAFRVVDAKGLPVPNADVWLRMRGGSSRGQPTDGDGVLVLTLPVGDVDFFVRRQIGAVATAVRVRVAPTGNPERIELRLGGETVEGKLVGGDGKPANGHVRLVALSTDASEATAPGDRSAWEREEPGIGSSGVRAGPDGRFRLEEVSTGLYLLEHRAAHSTGWRRGEQVSGGRRDLVVEVQEGLRLLIEVLDEDGRPSREPEVGVSLFGHGRTSTLSAQREAGQAGVYRAVDRYGLTGPGEYDVMVYPGAGFRAVHVGRRRLGAEEVRVTARSVRGPRVEGRIRDTAGAPVEGVRVRVGTLGYWGLPDVATPSATTGRDGKFEIPGLPFDDVKLEIEDDFVASTEVRVETGGSAKTVEFVVERAGLIVLRMRDGLKPPLSAVSVTGVGGDLSEQVLSFGPDRAPPAGPVRLGGLRPGAYRITGTQNDEEFDAGTVEVVAGKVVEVLIPPK